MRGVLGQGSPSHSPSHAAAAAHLPGRHRHHVSVTGNDGRVSGRSLRAYFLLTGLMSLGYGTVLTLLADIRDRFSFSDSDVGLIAFAGFAAGFVAQVLLARYADRGYSVVMVRAGLAAAALAMGWLT